MEIDVTQDFDATAAVEFVTLADENTGSGHSTHNNLIGQGRKQHHALRQQAKRRRKNTTIAASGGCGGGTGAITPSVPRIIVKPLPPPPPPTHGATEKSQTTAFNTLLPMEEVIVSTAALPLRTMPTMREVLASIPGFSIKAPKKRNNKKLSAAAQLEQTKEGCIDLETPDSILVNTNLRSLLNKYTFSLLPPLYQHKLVQLLPNVDRQVVTNTSDSLRLQPSSLNNEFFARACLEWQERLAEGEFTPEHQQKLRSEADRERSKLDPWKLKHFEPIWGDRSGYLHYDLSNDPNLLLQQQSSAQSGATGNNTSSLRPPIKTTIKLRPSPSSSHHSSHSRSSSLRNSNSNCYSTSNYSSGSTSSGSSNSLNSSPVKRLRTVGAMTRSCTSGYYTRSESLTSTTDKSLDSNTLPTVTINTNVRGTIPDLLPIRGTRSAAAALAAAAATAATGAKASEVMIPQVQHTTSTTKEVDPLLLPDTHQQHPPLPPSTTHHPLQQLLHHLPHTTASSNSSARNQLASTTTCQPIAGIHLPEISIINISETIMPSTNSNSGTLVMEGIGGDMSSTGDVIDIGRKLHSSITITKTGGLSVSGDKKRRRSRSRNNSVELIGGVKQQRRSTTTSTMSATDVAAVFANKRNDLEIFVIEPEIISTDLRSIESTTTTTTTTSLDDPSNDDLDNDDDDDDIDDIQEIQVVDEDMIMMLDEDEEIEEIEEIDDEELILEEVSVGNSTGKSVEENVVVDIVVETSSVDLDEEGEVDDEDDEEVEEEFEVLEEDILKEGVAVLSGDCEEDLESQSSSDHTFNDVRGEAEEEQEQTEAEQLESEKTQAESQEKIANVVEIIEDITQEDDCSENCSLQGNNARGDDIRDDVVEEDELEKEEERENDKVVITAEEITTTIEEASSPQCSPTVNIPNLDSIDPEPEQVQQELLDTKELASSPSSPSNNPQDLVDTEPNSKQQQDEEDLTAAMLVVVDAVNEDHPDCQIDSFADSTQKIDEIKSPCQSTSNNSDSNSQTDFQFGSDNANEDDVVFKQTVDSHQVPVETFSDISASSFCDDQQQQEMLSDDGHHSADLDLVESNLVDSYLLPGALILQHQQSQGVGGGKGDCLEDLRDAAAGQDDDEKLDSIASSLVNSTNFPCSGHTTIISHGEYEDEEANEDRFLDAETYVLESGQISLDDGDGDCGGTTSADTTSSSATTTTITVVVQPSSSSIVTGEDHLVDGMVVTVAGCSKEEDEDVSTEMVMATADAGGVLTDGAVEEIGETLFGNVNSDLLEGTHHLHHQHIPTSHHLHHHHSLQTPDQDDDTDCCWDDVVDSSTEKLLQVPLHSLDDTSTPDVVLNHNSNSSSNSNIEGESSPSASGDGSGTSEHQLMVEGRSDDTLMPGNQQVLIQEGEIDGEQQVVVGVLGVDDQEQLVEEVVRLEEFPVVSVSADWLAAQYEVKVDSNNSMGSVSSVASINSVASITSAGTTCSSMVPTLASTHSGGSTRSGSQSGSNSNSNSSSDMDDGTMELPPLHSLTNDHAPHLVIVGTTDNLHQHRQLQQLDNVVQQHNAQVASTSSTAIGGPAPSIGSLMAATNGNVVSTSFPPTVHFTEYMAGNQLKLELEVTLTPEIVNSENMVSSTVGTVPGLSTPPSSIANPTSINATAMPRLTLPTGSVPKSVSAGIPPNATIVCLPHPPNAGAAQYQHQPCHSVEALQQSQQIPASFLHQQQQLLLQQQQATNAVYGVPQMVRTVAASSAAGSTGINAQMPGASNNAALPYLALASNSTTGQHVTRVRSDGSTTTSSHKSKKKSSSSSSRSSTSRSNSHRDNKPPPPGAVNLERSYQICQAVIQNSPNRDQLRGQLKPPPSSLLATATVNSAKAKAAASSTSGSASSGSVSVNVSGGGSNSCSNSSASAAAALIGGTVQYAGVTTSSRKGGNSGTFTPPLVIGTPGGAPSPAVLQQGYQMLPGGNGVKVKTRVAPYTQQRQPSPPVLLRHVFTNNQGIPVTMAVLPQGQPINQDLLADTSHHHPSLTTSASTLGSTPPPQQQQQYIIVQQQTQPAVHHHSHHHGGHHQLQHVRSSSTNGVLSTARDHPPPPALVPRSSSAPPNSQQAGTPQLLMTTAAGTPYSPSASSNLSPSSSSSSSCSNSSPSTPKQLANNHHHHHHHHPQHLSYQQQPLPTLPPLTITNNNHNHHHNNTVPTTTTTMVVVVNNDQQLQQSNAMIGHGPPSSSGADQMMHVQCGPNPGTQAVTRRPRGASRLVAPQGTVFGDVGTGGTTQARLHTTYTVIGGDMEQHPGAAMMLSNKPKSTSNHQQSTGAASSATPAAKRASAADSSCPCSLKALVICKKCGAFCHDDCISANKLCRTCYIR